MRRAFYSSQGIVLFADDSLSRDKSICPRVRRLLRGRRRAMQGGDARHYVRLLVEHTHEMVVYCMVFTSFGMCVGFLGPTLWDLGCQTSTELSSMTWMFLAQTLFVLVGSVLAGVIVQSIIPAHLLLLLGSLGIATTLALMPWASSSLMLGATLGAMGLAMGAIDTTANVCVIQLFTQHVTPFLQCLHFCYGIGAFLSPMMVEPFLRSFDCSLLINNGTKLSELERLINAEQDTPQAHNTFTPQSLEQAKRHEHVDRAFVFMAIVQIPVTIAVISLLLRPSRRPLAQSNTKTYGQVQAGTYAEEGTVPVAMAPLRSPSFHRRVVGIACLLLFLADGMQASFAGFVFSYSKVAVAGTSASQAVFLNAAFWASFAFGRLVAIFAALYIAPALLLLVDLVGGVSAMLLMLSSPGHARTLCTSTMLFGFFLSNVCPSVIALVEQFVRIGPHGTTVLVVGAAAGELIFPVVVGQLFNSFGPTAFVLVGNVTLVAMLGVFAVLCYAGVLGEGEEQSTTLASVFSPEMHPEHKDKAQQTYAQLEH